MKRFFKIRVHLIIYIFIGLCCTNCGYHFVGIGSEIPPEIKTVYIPDFNNKTTQFQAEQYVSEALRKEFIKRTDLELVDNYNGADSVLEGEIKKFEVKPISYSQHGSANLYTVSIHLTVKFIDLRNNKTLFENSSLKYSDSYEIGSGGFFALEQETLENIAKEFAASIVTIIFQKF